MITTLVVGAYHWCAYAIGAYGVKTAIVGTTKWVVNYGWWLAFA